MPPKVRITKKMIEDASVEVIRKNGHENLNARTIAKFLNCSTQPVLYSFKNVDEIRKAVYRLADGYHIAFIMPKETNKNPMLALGVLAFMKKWGNFKNLFLIKEKGLLGLINRAKGGNIGFGLKNNTPQKK